MRSLVPSQYGSTAPLGTSVGSLLRHARPELFKATGLSDFLSLSDRSEFSCRDPGTLESAQKLLRKLKRDDIDWIFGSAISDGLQERGEKVARATAIRDLLLPHISREAIVQNANAIIRHTNLTGAERMSVFARRTLRELMKVFPTDQNQTAQLLGFGSAQEMIRDTLEKASHADMKPTQVPGMMRVLQFAFAHVRLSGDEGRKYLALCAERAFTILCHEAKYEIKENEAPYLTSRYRGSWGFGDDDFDDAVVNRPHHRPTPASSVRKEVKRVCLLDKVVDDLSALESQSGFGFMGESTRTEAYTIWRGWAEQRRALAQICFLVLGEAGTCADAFNQEKYARILRKYIRTGDKALSGCAISALGTLAYAMPMSRSLALLSEMRETIKGFREGGGWEKTHRRTALAIKVTPLKDIELDQLRAHLCDADPKIRKAAFKKIMERCDGESELGRISTLTKVGIIPSPRGGYDDDCQIPFLAAGRREAILWRYVENAADPLAREKLGVAWAAVATVNLAARQRKSAHLPTMEEIIPKLLAESDRWSKSSVEATLGHLEHHLDFGRLFGRSLGAWSSKMLGGIILQLLPKLPAKAQGKHVELLIEHRLPVVEIAAQTPDHIRLEVEGIVLPVVQACQKATGALELLNFYNGRSLFESHGKERKTEAARLARDCGIHDLLFFADRILTAKPSDPTTDESSVSRIAGMNWRDAALLIIESGTSLSKEDLEPLLERFEHAAANGPGQGRSYYEFAPVRDFGFRAVFAVAKRLCMAEPHEAAIMTIKRLLASNDEVLQSKMIEEIPSFVCSLPEAEWPEFVSMVYGVIPQNYWRQRFFTELVKHSNDAVARASYLERLLDGLEQRPCNGYTNLLKEALGPLLQPETLNFIERVRGKIKSIDRSEKSKIEAACRKILGDPEPVDSGDHW